MPRQTPMTGPRPVGPKGNTGSQSGPDETPQPDGYDTAKKVLGRSEEPKLQGKQSVIGSNREEGAGGSIGGLPQANMPQFGQMSPGSYSAGHPSRQSPPSAMGPSPTNPSQGAYDIADPGRVAKSDLDVYANFDGRFLL